MLCLRSLLNINRSNGQMFIVAGFYYLVFSSLHANEQTFSGPSCQSIQIEIKEHCVKFTVKEKSQQNKAIK